ncbi:MAG: hypothetical protein KDD45_12620 [Bdellovibrionales bacterium]|nr:hypothetical protein [Bdellovibrionales bacterium]
MDGEMEVNLSRAIKEWCTMMVNNKQHNKSLNVRIFEALKEEFMNDVEVTEVKKPKEQK